MFVRWNKNFEKQSIDFTVMDLKDNKLSKECKTEVISEVIIFTNDDQTQIKFDIPHQQLKDTLDKMRGHKSRWCQWFNERHPNIVFTKLKTYANQNMIFNSTISFQWDGNSENTINVDLPKL